MSGLHQRISAEMLGSLLLSGVVIGSGVMASRLSDGNDALALLANTGATASVLFVLISAFGPISGAHFNPAVTLVMSLHGAMKTNEALLYVVAQTCGCILGGFLAHAMFDLPVLQMATQHRSGLAQGLSEVVATFALVLTILMVSRARPTVLPAAVALIIAAGYWWTASTSFANPAITIARAMSDSFAGVHWADASQFILAQVLGALAALAAASVVESAD